MDILKAIQDAIVGATCLTDEYLKIEGMSSNRIKHLLAALIEQSEDDYLEVGTWKGSTFIPAAFAAGRNGLIPYGVDNFSEFGSPLSELYQNLSRYLVQNKYKFFAQDFLSLDDNDIPRNSIGVYFYDGAHDFKAQEDAITHAMQFFADECVLVIDDYNWEYVQDGTAEGLRNISHKYVVRESVVLPTAYNGDVDSWWNGLLVAKLKKV